MKLRFTIRDLFWLVLVVALAVGWWVDRKSLEPYKQQWLVHQQELQRVFKTLNVVDVSALPITPPSDAKPTAAD